MLPKSTEEISRNSVTFYLPRWHEHFSKVTLSKSRSKACGEERFGRTPHSWQNRSRLVSGAAADATFP